jgi:phage terminase large subunit-like protein
VWASDGKRTRAKPVASLFGHDPDHPLPYRARLVGFHEELEEELTTTVFDGTELSPNRLDALVWAFSYLLLGSIGFDEGVVRDERLAGRR